MKLANALKYLTLMNNVLLIVNYVVKIIRLKHCLLSSISIFLEAWFCLAAQAIFEIYPLKMWDQKHGPLALTSSTS